MTLLEFFYYIGYSLDKRYKLKRQKRLPHKVISIGNITVGGTGKTPAAIAIVEEAKKRGFQPIILTRGYKGKVKGPCFVKDRNALSVMRNELEKKSLNASRITHHASRLYGDEPVLMAERLKDVPIVKCSDRYEGGMFALQHLSAHSPIHPFTHSPILFILDDGFQHRQLHRDVDIVLIDGSNPFGNRKLLPAGPLREPLKELKRARIFVITKQENEAALNELKGINPDAPVYFSDYRAIKIKDMQNNKFPSEMLKDKRVFAFCGIANPESFKKTVLPLCGEFSGLTAYRDHYRYSESDVLYLQNQCKILNCDLLITTEKDMVKIKEIQNAKSKIQIDNILCLEIDFCVEPEFFDEVFKTIPP